MNANPQNFIVTIMTGLLAAGSLPAETLGPTKGSRFALEVYKTGFMSGKKHVFVFERYGGELVFDPRKPDAAKVRFSVDAGSIVCTDTWVSEKDRKKVLTAARDEMLQVDKYPHIVFVSSRALAKGENQYDVEGMLTIRDAAKPVVVHVTVKEGVFEGSARLKLSDYGLKPPKAALGMVGTKDEMTVLFRLIAKSGR